MFIKIKAQSSDLEKQYIKERDIFKKKRNGPKFLLSGLLVVAIGGYFYYLNSGNPLQTSETTIASSGLEQNDITMKNNVISDDVESDHQSKLITEAQASDESQQVATTRDNFFDSNNDSNEQDEDIVAPPQTDESVAEIPNDEPEMADNSMSDEFITAEQDLDAIELEAESLVTDADTEVDEEIDKEELTQKQQIDVVEVEDLAIDDSEYNATATSINEEITQADIAEIKTEDFLIENIAEKNLELDNPQTEQISFSKIGLDEGIETDNAVNEQSRDVEISQTVSSLESQTPESTTKEKDSALPGESETKDIDNTQINISDEPALAITDEANEETVMVDEVIADVQFQVNVDNEIINQNSNTIEPLALEVSDQSLAVESQSASNTSTVEKVRESRPIKAISKMISNVFAKSNVSDEQEFVADVIEIDFSEVTDAAPNEAQERVAIIKVTDSVEPSYQGSSIEELMQSSNDVIDTAALDVIEVTTFEVSETEVNEIIEIEKQLRASETSRSASKSIESLFEGVDSIAAVEIPKTTLPVTKTETPETIPSETKQSETEKKRKEPAATPQVVKVETVEVAKIEPKSIKNTNQPIKTGENRTDLVAATTSFDIETTTDNKSTITIEDLYDQLMSDLDQKETVTTDSNEPAAADKSTEKITIKQLYEQVTKAAELDQAAVAIEKAAIATKLPTETTNTAVEIKIDPDKSLAMTDSTDSSVSLDPVEEIIIDSIDQANVAEEDKTSNKNEIESASINTLQLTDNKGSTALMIAALNADLQAARELVQQGAQVNKRNDWGWTALLNATIKGNKPLVEYLLRNGASPHLADNDGRSPLMAAVLNNHPEIVKTLLNHSADVNKSNRDGWTALSFAAWKGNTASVKYLLDANAFKQHRTSEGLTPLQLARKGGHIEVVNLLSL